MSSEAAQKAAREALGMADDEPNGATGHLTREYALFECLPNDRTPATVLNRMADEWVVGQ